MNIDVYFKMETYVCIFFKGNRAILFSLCLLEGHVTGETNLEVKCEDKFFDKVCGTLISLILLMPLSLR